MFENITISEIKELLLTAFQSKFNHELRLLPKSFIRVLSTVLAGVFVTLYKQIGWFFLQIFPETAYWGEVSVLGKKIRPLVKWGVLVGAGEPKTGSRWRGTITVEVSHSGAFLPAGTQLKAGVTGKLYITETGVFLENPTEIVPVTCAESGSAGNLESGDTVSFAAPLGTVNKNAVVASVTAYAADDETESAYRSRVANRFRSPPMGGALSDYRVWGQGVDGVLNVYPYKDLDSPSGVLLFVSGIPDQFPDRIPSADLLIQTGNACTFNPETGKADRKPIGAVLDPDFNGTYANIKPITVTAFDVHITGLSGVSAADFAEALKPELENYFLEREPYIRGLSDDNNKTNVIDKNNVIGKADQIALSVKGRFTSASLAKDGEETAVYTLGQGELAKLGILFIEGVLYG